MGCMQARVGPDHSDKCTMLSHLHCAHKASEVAWLLHRYIHMHITLALIHRDMTRVLVLLQVLFVQAETAKSRARNYQSCHEL